MIRVLVEIRTDQGMDRMSSSSRELGLWAVFGLLKALILQMPFREIHRSRTNSEVRKEKSQMLSSNHLKLDPQLNQSNSKNLENLHKLPTIK